MNAKLERTLVDLSRTGLKLSLGLLVFALFIFPTRTFQTLPAGEWLDHFSSLLIAMAIGLGVFFLLVERVLANPLEIAPRENVLPIILSFRKVGYLNLGLVLLIFIGTAVRLNTPLDIDENIHALGIARGHLRQELNPINIDPQYYSQNHVVPQLLSILSAKIFGLSKLSYRGPALIFTGLLLLALIFIAPNLIGSPLLSLLLGHLACNQSIEWYFHSARGYVGMMAINATTLLLVWDFTRRPRILNKARIALFFLGFTLAIFTHMFSALFNTLLWLSLLTWLAMNRQDISEAARRSGIRLLVAGAITFPVLAFVLARNLIFLSRIGDLNAAQTPDLNESLMGMMGCSLTWQGKLIVVLITILLLHQTLHFPRRFKTLTSLFLMVSLLFFASALGLLKTRVFEARFILAFSLPFLIWVGESIESFESAIGRKSLWFLAVLVLVASPLLSRGAIYNLLSRGMDPYDQFLRQTRALTAPVSEACYSVVGQQDISIWAKEFYLNDSLKNESCPRHYFIKFPKGNDTRFPPLTQPWPQQTRKLLSNDRGMSLWEVF